MTDKLQGGITVKNLSKNFKDTKALSNITFNIEKGGLLGVLGPDGAGKTTLCRVLSGVLSPSEGEVKIKSLDIVSDCEKIKKFTGYLPRDFGLYSDLSVEENIDFYADIFGVDFKSRETRKKRLLEITGLSNFTKRPAGRLSGGMKQKLQLTCSLIHTPEFLILDEPTYGVDPVSRREFWKLLSELIKESLTIVLATSYMDEAQRCQNIALLSEGKLLKLDTPESIISQIEGKMFEIICGNAVSAAEILKKEKNVKNVTVYGDSLHVLMELNADKDHIISVIKDEIISSEEISPSLEDCFIYFTESRRL